MYIVKKSGRKQTFNKAKIVRGCIRAGAEKKKAIAIGSIVSKKVVEGMSTRKIGEMVVSELKRRDKKAAAHYYSYFKKGWK